MDGDLDGIERASIDDGSSAEDEVTEVDKHQGKNKSSGRKRALENSVDGDSNFVSFTLKKWQLDEYLPNFEREKIDQRSFFTIPDSEVRKLIEPIGPCYQFLANRQELETRPPSSQASGQSSTEAPPPGEKLRILLTKSRKGRSLLASEHVTSDKNLCGIVTDYIANKHEKSNSEVLAFWAREIVAVFPTESTKKWFSPYTRGKTASGKLYNKLTNDRKAELKISKQQRKETEAEEIIDVEEAAQYLDELKVTDLKDEEKIKELWQKSFNARQQTGDITEYYERFPQLATPLGATLISLDYKHMNLSTDGRLRKEWPDFAKKLLILGNQKKSCTEVLEEADDVHADTLAFRVLPYLLRPCLMKSGKPKKTWKPSYKEQADGFISWINVITDLDQVLKTQQKLMTSLKLTLQPFVVAVGSPKQLEALYVVINNVKYRFKDLISAVDFCFKSFYALDASYPISSEPVWAFLQTEIYGIMEPPTNFLSVATLVTQLANIEKFGTEEDSS